MKKITMYTGPLCNYCEAAKRLLARNNAPYNEIDISKVDGAMDEMIKKSLFISKRISLGLYCCLAKILNKVIAFAITIPAFTFQKHQIN